MPWIDATLRGARVLARVRDDGSLAEEGGRVEIRYKPGEGRPYRAVARNLVVDPAGIVHADGYCSEVVAAAETVRKAAKGPSDGTPHGEASTEGRWHAYTDGACSGNPGPAGSGVVLVAPNGKMHEGYEYLGQATNNVAELTAILRALEWIPREARAGVVYTDSQYAIGVLQKGWKAKANGELVARTKREVQSRGAHLAYVPGHRGVVLNERADELAREAITSRSTREPFSP